MSAQMHQPCTSCGRPSDGWPDGKQGYGETGELCQLCWERHERIAEATAKLVEAAKAWRAKWSQDTQRELLESIDALLEAEKA